MPPSDDTARTAAGEGAGQATPLKPPTPPAVPPPATAGSGSGPSDETPKTEPGPEENVAPEYKGQTLGAWIDQNYPARVVLAAGMVADDPELDQPDLIKTDEEWQEAFDAYATSERP